jgi:hypothetical protein
MTVKTTSYIVYTVFVFEVGYSVVTFMVAFYIRHNAEPSINALCIIFGWHEICSMWLNTLLTAANAISMIQIPKHLVNISVCYARFYIDIGVLLPALSHITSSLRLTFCSQYWTANKSWSTNCQRFGRKRSYLILLQFRHIPAVNWAKLQNLSQQSKFPAIIRTKNAQIQVAAMKFCIISMHYKFKIISSTKYTAQACRRDDLATTRSKAWVCSCSLAGHACRCCVMHCQVEVSASDRSLVGRSPYRLWCV